LTGPVGTDREGYHNLLAAGRRWPDRVWAVGSAIRQRQRHWTRSSPLVDASLRCCN